MLAGDDAVEKNKLELMPVEMVEGTMWPPGTTALLTALAFSRPSPS
jgi:hypothetical protein